MQPILRISLIVLLSLPFPAWALSCAWLDAEQAKNSYPVAVLGTVLESHFEPSPKPIMLQRGYQHVTLKVTRLHAPEETTSLAMAAEQGSLQFREIITAYDGSFFKQGQSYLVFLNHNPDSGQLEYPVCGTHFPADDAESLAVIGWNTPTP